MWVNPGGSFLPPFILAIACFSSTLVASGFTDDEEESAAGEDRVLETVQVTATRSEQSIYAVSEAVTVIDTEAINRKAPELLAEMLRGVPGAFFNRRHPARAYPLSGA